MRLCSEASEFKRQAFAESTKITYKSQLNCFLRFCLFYKRVIVPTDLDTLRAYIAFLARSLYPSSIPGYMNVIRLIHLDAGFPNPLLKNFEIEMISRGIRRSLGKPPVQKLPISIKMLIDIFSLLNMDVGADRAFWAASLVAFFGMLRKSTLLPMSVSDHTDHFLLRSDIVSLSLNYFMLRVRHSKTIQYGQRVLMLPFVSCANTVVCPVTSMLNLLGRNKFPPGTPLFSYQNQRGIEFWTHKSFVLRLKVLLGKIGLDPASYSGHSFRRGGCTFSYRAGLDLTSIKLRGDWKSNSFERYLHVPAVMILQNAIALSEYAAC